MTDLLNRFIARYISFPRDSQAFHGRNRRPSLPKSLPCKFQSIRPQIFPGKYRFVLDDAVCAPSRKYYTNEPSFFTPPGANEYVILLFFSSQPVPRCVKSNRPVRDHRPSLYTAAAKQKVPSIKFHPSGFCRCAQVKRQK